MKKIAITLALLLAAISLGAQTAPEGYEYADSLVFTPLSAVDSTLSGRNVFSAMPNNVRIVQSSSIRNAVEARSRQNASQNVQGYRIRIFFDNSQTARGASEAALYRFKVKNPEVAAYRSFTSPYFKVTVGDYRNRSEALAALQEIRKDFPTAFIVRENFKYPAMENMAAFKIDTVRFLRPVQK